MALARGRRLPGIGFQVQAPRPVDVLPRMDVTVFIGFAASGPLHAPVAVEDPAEFARVFGAALPLAWDRARGEQLYAHLYPAVLAYFRNGGKRCWVIRVADENAARYNYFPIPSLARIEIHKDGTLGEVAPSRARARSEGSWSDALEVGSALHRRPIEILDGSLELSAASGGAPPSVALTVLPISSSDLSAGDLLRIWFQAHGHGLFAAVRTIGTPSPAETSPPSGSRARGVGPLRVACGPPLWFRTVPPEEALAPGRPITVVTFHGDAAPEQIPVLDWSATERGEITLFLDPSVEAPPRPGSVLQATVGASTMWFTVYGRSTAMFAGSPPREAIRVTGQGVWRTGSPPSDLAVERPTCDVLTLELRARMPNRPPALLTDLGFDARHESFWAALPTDAELYEGPNAASEQSHRALWESALDPRFPLAGRGRESALYFPVAMPFEADFFLGSENDGGSALERDGLSRFDSALFLDGQVAATRTVDLLAEADFLRYQSPTPRPLRGIHAALGIEEATVLAIPDAIHVGWDRAGVELPAPPHGAPVREQDWAHFVDCALRALEPPHLLVKALAADAQLTDRLYAPSGSFLLRWSRSAGEDAEYVLQESDDPRFAVASTLYSGPDCAVTTYGKGAGRFFYRVRAAAKCGTSAWSNGVVVQTGPGPEWILRPDSEYDPDALLAIHRSSIRLCAARGDLMALLTLPAHFREEECIEYVSTLRSPSAANDRPQPVEPLGASERCALSYAALYHPWLFAQPDVEPSVIGRMPPDGAACGIIARRARSRGAWVAPANEPMYGVVALAPSIAPAWRLRLQDAQINLIRSEPQGYLCLNSDTLSVDEELRPINVRRLLILLRRLALRLGATYVFEPNDDAFRRRIQRGFESMLGSLHARGAFSDPTPEHSYRVVTDSTVNPAESVEQGRFVAELRVAPSVPMRFVTIRLVQSGDRPLVAIEG